MKKHITVQHIDEASGFNSFQEAIDWIEDTIKIGSQDHYTATSKVSTVPPLSIKIFTNEEYFIQNDIDEHEPILNMSLVFILDKSNTLDDFIELKYTFLNHLKSIQGTYYDYDIKDYVINYDTPEGSMNLFDYHLTKVNTGCT